MEPSHPKIRQCQVPLLDKKLGSSQYLWQVSSNSQLHYEEGVFTLKGLLASKQESEMNMDNKSAR